MIPLEPGKGRRVVDDAATSPQVSTCFLFGHGVNLRPLRMAQELPRETMPEPVRDLVRVNARHAKVLCQAAGQH
jgi:hypothetical protein